MKKDAYYFSHDSNARNDIKMIQLRRNLGMEAIGVFWCIIEILRESPRYRLKISNLRDISYDLQIKEDLVKDIVNNYYLFTVKGDEFYSQRLCKSMLQWDKTKKKLSQAGQKGNAIRWRSGGDGQVIAIREEKRRNKEKPGPRELPIGQI